MPVEQQLRPRVKHIGGQFMVRRSEQRMGRIPGEHESIPLP